MSGIRIIQGLSQGYFRRTRNDFLNGKLYYFVKYFKGLRGRSLPNQSACSGPDLIFNGVTCDVRSFELCKVNLSRFGDMFASSQLYVAKVSGFLSRTGAFPCVSGKPSHLIAFLK